jgi:hypothetical protein
MNGFLFRTLGVAAIALSLTACNRNPSQNATAPEQAPAASPAPAAPPPPSVPEIPAATELPLNSVNSVMLSRPTDAPTGLVIHVSGTAVSAGWTDAKLTEEQDNGGDASIKSYRFVATSPAMPDENRTAQIMETEFRVEMLPAEIKIIRIVSATNEISAPIAQ